MADERVPSPLAMMLDFAMSGLARKDVEGLSPREVRAKVEAAHARFHAEAQCQAGRIADGRLNDINGA